MIVRGGLPHDNYTITSNQAIEDTSVSLKARMILIYLLSRPPGWVTSAERLAGQISEKDGLAAIKSGLRELERAGYLVRTRSQGEDGRWRWDHKITDRPSVENRPPAEPSVQVSEPEVGRIPQVPAVEQDSENMQSSIGRFSTDGSSTDGKPTGISKTEVTKTPLPPSPSSLPKKAERERLRWYPSKEYVSLAADRWPTWLDTINTRQYTIAYLDAMDAKGWKYTDDGWLKHLEWEQVELARRTRGRAYSPTGVPL